MAKTKSTINAKRRIGGTDAVGGSILASLKGQKTNLAPTLGGAAKAYTGEA